MAAASEEYARLDELLSGLADDDWRRPTDCSGWLVRDVVAHLVGTAESMARPREGLRQLWRARGRPGSMLVDRLNDVQVSERVDLRPSQLLTDLRDSGTRAVRTRSRLPGLLRRVPVPFGPPLGTRPVGYLTDRIYTRDAWMHRIDLARATGRPLRLTPEHDGRLVADVVGEWAEVHGRPFRLTLTGPAGGTWQPPSGGGVDPTEVPNIELDAVDLVRTLSGRRPAGHDLLRHPVPF
jgi:uncharacterized protein (TIGR03083 family)